MTKMRQKKINKTVKRQKKGKKTTTIWKKYDEK